MLVAQNDEPLVKEGFNSALIFLHRHIVMIQGGWILTYLPWYDYSYL